MAKKVVVVLTVGTIVALCAVYALPRKAPIGPTLVLLSTFPLAGLILSRRSIKGAVPDIVFGAIDTGMLTIPALWGGAAFGVAGAIAGGVVGDALTDAIAGYFEGSIEQWLKKRGVEASREAVTTSLGKMAGCLAGSGLVLSVVLIFGIQPRFQ